MSLNKNILTFLSPKQMNKIKGIYQHTKSKKYYNVIGVGRAVENPNHLIVIYKQMYESKLRNHTDIVLPAGSIWTRDYSDFISLGDNNQPKFVKVKAHNYKLDNRNTEDDIWKICRNIKIGDILKMME